jgi:hypothetical protein
MYARATKSVSLVPPAYYADLACERGRCYLNEFLAAGTQRSARSFSDEEKKCVFEEAEKYWGNGVNLFCVWAIDVNLTFVLDSCTPISKIPCSICEHLERIIFRNSM